MHLKNGTNELHFYYGSDGKPAFVRMGVDWYAYVYNLQGDVIALTNNSGSVVVAYSYDAWGKPLATTGTLGRLNPFRYRGYVWDEETGLYYLRSRYYRAEICRFLNADAEIDVRHITGLFLSIYLYSYCANNPVICFDKDGSFWDTIFDVVSLAGSIIEAVHNPSDPWAWAAVAGDACYSPSSSSVLQMK